jgi:hypothetical protein
MTIGYWPASWVERLVLFLPNHCFQAFFDQFFGDKLIWFLTIPSARGFKNLSFVEKPFQFSVLLMSKAAFGPSVDAREWQLSGAWNLPDSVAQKLPVATDWTVPKAEFYFGEMPARYRS